MKSEKERLQRNRYVSCVLFGALIATNSAMSAVNFSVGEIGLGILGVVFVVFQAIGVIAFIHAYSKSEDRKEK